MHRLESKTLVTVALLRRFEAEAADYGGVYLAYIEKRDGTFLDHASPGAPAMSHDQQMMALDILHRLNADLAHDGAWVCMAIGPKPAGILMPLANPAVDYAILMYLWMDAEGDVRFPVEFEDTVANMARKGILYWLEQAENAWRTWKGLMIDVLDPKPNQQHARARGEDAPSLKSPTVR
jgi:hypothetical protein